MQIKKRVLSVVPKVYSICKVPVRSSGGEPSFLAASETDGPLLSFKRNLKSRFCSFQFCPHLTICILDTLFNVVHCRRIGGHEFSPRFTWNCILLVAARNINEP